MSSSTMPTAAATSIMSTTTAPQFMDVQSMTFSCYNEIEYPQVKYCANTYNEMESSAGTDDTKVYPILLARLGELDEDSGKMVYPLDLCGDIYKVTPKIKIGDPNPLKFGVFTESLMDTELYVKVIGFFDEEWLGTPPDLTNKEKVIAYMDCMKAREFCPGICHYPNRFCAKTADECADDTVQVKNLEHLKNITPADVWTTPYSRVMGRIKMSVKLLKSPSSKITEIIREGLKLPEMDSGRILAAKGMSYIQALMRSTG